MFKSCQQQTTRGSGFSNKDVGLKSRGKLDANTTARLMFTSMSRELEELKQIYVKQLKNRYNYPTMAQRFIIGMNEANETLV